MAIKINIRGPNGNTMQALGIATKVMRRLGHHQKDIDDLRLMVVTADNYLLARGMIEYATGYAVQFYDPDDEEIPSDVYV